MKRYIFAALCMSSLAHGMEVAKQTREPREWNADDYAKGNKTQQLAALKFLIESGINLKKRKVLDIGCGTGNVTAQIAEMANKAHGIDASKNMIEYANKKYFVRDFLTFEHTFAEDFVAQDSYDVATTFFCLHWIQDKENAIKNVNRALSLNGEFFGTHQSTSDPEPLHFTVLKEIIPGMSTFLNIPFFKDWLSNTDYSILSDEEFHRLLAQNGFEMISYEQKSFDITITKEELENGIRPVLMSRPFMKIFNDSFKEWFFNYYVNETIKKLTQNADNTYTIPANVWGTKVFHARKIAEV